jgi:hypothetical protein
MRSSMSFIVRILVGTFALGAAAGCTIINHDCDFPRGGVQWCESNDDCADLGVSCDPEAHRCRTQRDAGARDGATGADAAAVRDGSNVSDAAGDAGVASGCTRVEDCAAGSVCSDGRCLAASEACQFDFQCPAARECVDGRCLQRCATGSGTSTCAAGQRCATDGHCRYPVPGDAHCPGACPADQQCVGNACLAVCSAEASCGPGQRCEAGNCRADDHRAPPFCASDAQCATGSVCRAGVCRAACPTGTDEECLRRDVNFNRCSTEHVCMSTGEIVAACRLSRDCDPGQTCINARCL